MCTINHISLNWFLVGCVFCILCVPFFLNENLVFIKIHLYITSFWSTQLAHSAIGTSILHWMDTRVIQLWSIKLYHFNKKCKQHYTLSYLVSHWTVFCNSLLGGSVFTPHFIYQWNRFSQHIYTLHAHI